MRQADLEGKWGLDNRERYAVQEIIVIVIHWNKQDYTILSPLVFSFSHYTTI